MTGARFKKSHWQGLGQGLRDSIRQNSNIDSPSPEPLFALSRTAFRCLWIPKTSKIPTQAQSPPWGIQGDIARPIRANIAFDFSFLLRQSTGLSADFFVRLGF